MWFLKIMAFTHVIELFSCLTVFEATSFVPLFSLLSFSCLVKGKIRNKMGDTPWWWSSNHHSIWFVLPLLLLSWPQKNPVSILTSIFIIAQTVNAPNRFSRNPNIVSHQDAAHNEDFFFCLHSDGQYYKNKKLERKNIFVKVLIASCGVYKWTVLIGRR